MNEKTLFHNAEYEISVTRNWLKIGTQSHAVHYLRRLTLEEAVPPRHAARAVFYTASILAVIQMFQIQRDSLPPLVGWMLLLSCFWLAAYASYIAYVKPDTRLLYIDFNDGEQIVVELPGNGIKQLHSALQYAMHSQSDSRLASSSSRYQPSEYS